MISPLYLNAKQAIQVSLEVPALSVVTSDKSRQLFPLSRISRVVVSGAVDWSMPALFACADAGVSVVFLNEQGEVRCRWFGRMETQYSIVQQFVELFQRADAPLKYQNWVSAMERMALRSCARRMRLDDWQQVDKQLLNSCIEQLLSEDWKRAVKSLHSFLSATCLSELSTMGLQPGCEYLLDGPVNLIDDLTALLIWDFYPAIVGYQKCFAKVLIDAQLVGFYESRRQRIDHLLRGLLNRLHQCLLEGM